MWITPLHPLGVPPRYLNDYTLSGVVLVVSTEFEVFLSKRYVMTYQGDSWLARARSFAAAAPLRYSSHSVNCFFCRRRRKVCDNDHSRWQRTRPLHDTFTFTSYTFTRAFTFLVRNADGKFSNWLRANSINRGSPFSGRLSSRVKLGGRKYRIELCAGPGQQKKTFRMKSIIPITYTVHTLDSVNYFIHSDRIIYYSKTKIMAELVVTQVKYLGIIIDECTSEYTCK